MPKLRIDMAWGPYEKGQVVEVGDKEGCELINMGVAHVLEAHKPEPPEEVKKPSKAGK